MFRLSLRLLLLLTPLSLLLVAAVPLLPYDDQQASEIQRFLLASDGCAANQRLCLFGPPGIYPGQTGMQDAIDRLQTHPWVTDVDVHYGMALTNSVIEWRWNGQQPNWLPVGGQLWVRDNIVSSVEIRTRLSYGTLWGVLGRPQQGLTGKTALTPPHLLHYGVFFDGQLELQLQVRCPLSPGQFWHAPATLWISTRPTRQMTGYDLPVWSGCGEARGPYNPAAP